MKTSIASFFTRTPSNEGSRLFLKDPVTDQPSEEWLHVLGFESDAFSAAMAVKQRRMSEIRALPEEEREGAAKEAVVQMLVSLVADWSFEEECTPDNVKTLFSEAPYIQSAVDAFAANRANFIKPRLTN